MEESFDARDTSTEENNAGTTDDANENAINAQTIEVVGTDELPIKNDTVSNHMGGSTEMVEDEGENQGEEEEDGVAVPSDTGVVGGLDIEGFDPTDGSRGEKVMERAEVGPDAAAPHEVIVNDEMYMRVRAKALAKINTARECRKLKVLSLDGALVVPATTHCRLMSEHGFLSHWDVMGRKPYQRYSDFAYGQHVSEVVFGFKLDEETEDEMVRAIEGCIMERAEADDAEEGGNSDNHLLESVHTHIGIGVFVSDKHLRYVEVYADRYMELLDAPAEISSSGAQLSVQISSAEVGPYACLVFHDPTATPLTIGELQQQFGGPYTDFSAAQVGVVWPWQMELLDDGVVDIPIDVSCQEPGTYYVQVLVCDDPSTVPYDAEPAGGLPLPGNSFCGGGIVLKAPRETAGEQPFSGTEDEDESLVNRRGRTLEEIEARAMASTTALRRDFAPIVSIRVVQQSGAVMLQDDGYEQAIFMPPERAEDMAQLNLGAQFLRLGVWDDSSSGIRGSEEVGSLENVTPTKPAETERSDIADRNGDEGANNEQKVSEMNDEMAPGAGDGPGDNGDTKPNDEKPDSADESTAEKIESGLKSDEAGNVTVSGDDQATEGKKGEEETRASTQTAAAPEADANTPPLVVTEIIVVTFNEGETIAPPDGFELVSEDLVDHAGSLKAPSDEDSGGLPPGEASERTASEMTPADADSGEEGRVGVPPASRRQEKVYLCAKRMPFTESVSPLTDIAVVYGTASFQMGFGFVTTALPQVVSELYGVTIHVCHKRAGASLVVIQQEAERVAERTARQIQQHLGIDGGSREALDAEQEDESYEIDTNMNPEQMLEWEEKRNREAAERADKREQAERARKNKEASEAVRRRILEASSEKEELSKVNAEWQKKVAALMLTQQKTREEARTEKEAIPTHESEKRYADCLAAIVNCRERLQEQQAEYDTVAIALQSRLDEKEYKAREIADSFREFKREIARTAEHSRTGKTIPKGVIAQFEAAEAKKDEEIEKVRLKNINLRMMLKKVEANLRAKEQLAEGLHLIDFEQLKIENQTVNEKIEERNEELLKLRKKNTTTVQILTHTKEKLQFIAAENSVTSHQLSSLEEDLNGERDCLTHAKKDRDALRTEVAALRQSQGFANSDLLILDFEQRKLHLKKLGQKLDNMRSKHHLLLLEQERLQESNEQRMNELTGMQP